ncbi:hypothetical protein CEXT_406271 [Caerostris extrusa]|uniref:Uncharacterized protein n=1 Tax=Caerostris extrusa TaxID=172846 RepID=A0AAV4VLQ7_CAEEX|nr:hypothetical protein CEXT_406271 [Caerostris extrusa]
MTKEPSSEQRSYVITEQISRSRNQIVDRSACVVEFGNEISRADGAPDDNEKKKIAAKLRSILFWKKHVVRIKSFHLWIIQS